MKFHGFALGHIEVEVEGRACDLHNFYVARAIHYALEKRTLSLRFTRRTEDWVPPEEPREITVMFHEVSYFSATGRHDSPLEDDTVLHAIGIVAPDAETQAFYLSDTFPADHHIVVCFASGLTLRLHAVEARCEIQC
ncbi:hypothetical protein B7453_20085 [Pseudomonas sp. IB20]|uniref:hypothetical protein n=1 Tax=Pseudomonas TaxID=286 RepID=UPI000BA00751|nr:MULTISPECIES: hypothetical protein [unclassified Pseudomonas]MCV2226258.1 hypothetical protein [Pseudomonas sp. AU10]OZO02707.1 hypothetical protein B7453_20085 [Pseudomonas sp. IB20]